LCQHGAPTWTSTSLGSIRVHHVHRVIYHERRAWDGRDSSSGKERTLRQWHMIADEEDHFCVSDTQRIPCTGSSIPSTWTDDVVMHRDRTNRPDILKAAIIWKRSIQTLRIYTWLDLNTLHCTFIFTGRCASGWLWRGIWCLLHSQLQRQWREWRLCSTDYSSQVPVQQHHYTEWWYGQ